MMKKQSMDVAHNSVQSLLRYITDPAKPSHWRTKTMKNLPDRIGPCTGIFWWDDHIPLFEFSLLQGDFEEPRGYVIASSSEALPPIIEYSLEGLTYSQKLHSYITTLLASRNILYSQISWYYWNPFEPVAMVSQHGKQGVTYYTVPTLDVVSLDAPISIIRNPEDRWDSENMSGQWRGILGSGRNVALFEEGGQRIGGGPTYYQQNCRALFKGDAPIENDTIINEPTNYCSPKCIAGCTPVAFAMLASCCKGDNIRNRGARIWPGSSTWYLDWSSFADTNRDPSRSPEVSDTIWQFHAFMETSCGGDTSTFKLAAAANRMFRQVWGIPEYFVNFQNDPSYEFCQHLINRPNCAPFVFSGFGDWLSYLKMLNVKDPFLIHDSTAHSTACWGWEYWADEGPPKLYVGLGWGNLFGSKYVDFNAFTARSACYIDF